MTVDLDFPACYKALGYTFKNPALLVQALTHSSIKSEERPSNERMEFLGDSILGQEISLHLYKTQPTLNEGELTKIKSVVVSRAVIAQVCERIGMTDFIIVGKGIRRAKFPVSMYANMFEALIAAMYLDGGTRPVRAFIRRLLVPEIEAVLRDSAPRNYKSMLQHYAQKHLRETPAYELVSEDGPDHNKTFQVRVRIGRSPYADGAGRSKKEAEQMAAAATLAQLQTATTATADEDDPALPAAGGAMNEDEE